MLAHFCVFSGSSQAINRKLRQDQFCLSVLYFHHSSQMLGLCLTTDPRLIYDVVFIPPPVHCGRVLCYWVRWIYQGQRVGQFTHRGDNYRVIGVLTLSALTMFVSFLRALSLHKHTQHVSRSWVNQKRKEKPASLSWDSGLYLFYLRGLVLNICVCLIVNMCNPCLQMFVYLFTTAHWEEHMRM